ncbi:MAG TPA: hypothetical protein VLE73_02655 [Candidatus Saccharimonadales bacterium]|nr:hypothetical protein [Candidatus Saccharimonadales bacterium]
MSLSESVQGAQYLDQIERIVGLRFFSQATLEDAARTDIAQLPQHDLQARAPLYIAGLGLLAEARKRFQLSRHAAPELTADQVLDIRETYKPQVTAIREGLLSLADVDAPTEVLSFGGVQKTLDLGTPILRRAIDKLGIIAVPYLNRMNQPVAYYGANDVDRILDYVQATLPVATTNEVRLSNLRATHRLDAETFAGILKELNIAPIPRRPEPRSRWAYYMSVGDAQLFEKHLQAMTATPDWITLLDIAERGEVSTDFVRNYIEFHDHVKLVAWLRTTGTGDSSPSVAHHVPSSLGERMIQHFRTIIPDGYLTINEFAKLYGLEYKQVERTIKRLKLPAHSIAAYTSDHTVIYLDGATMYTLRQHVKPHEQAPASWVDMQGFKRAVNAADTVIAKYLAGTEWQDMDRRKPPEGVGGLARTFFPPEAVEYVNSKLAPTVPPEGWIDLTTEATAEGVAISVVRNRLLKLGYTTPTKIRQGVSFLNYYPPEAMYDSKVEAIIGPQPLGWEPLPDVAAELGLSAIDLRLLLAEKDIPARVHKLTKTAVRELYCPSPTLLAGQGIRYASPEWPGGVEPVVYDAPEQLSIIPTEYLATSEFAHVSGIPLTLIKRHLRHNPDIITLTPADANQAEPFLDGETMFAMRNALRARKGSVSLEALATAAGITHTAVTNRLEGTPWQSPEPTMPPSGVGKPMGHYPPEAIAHVLRGRSGGRKHSPDPITPLDARQHNAVPFGERPYSAYGPPKAQSMPTPIRREPIEEPIIQEAPVPDLVVPPEYLTPADFARLEKVEIDEVRNVIRNRVTLHTFGKAKRFFMDGATIRKARQALRAKRYNDDQPIVAKARPAEVVVRPQTATPLPTPPAKAAGTSQQEKTVAEKQSTWRPRSWRREEPFKLESPASAATTPLKSPMAGGTTAFFSHDGARQAGESKIGLPKEKPVQGASHRPEIPGSWQPAVTTAPLISRTDTLTARQIAARLDIAVEVVEAAVAAVDPGQVEIPKNANNEPMYSKSMLLAIRQQLTGIPLEYVMREYNLDKSALQRALTYLRHHGYKAHDERLSPGAYQFLGANLANAKQERPSNDD